MLDEILCHRNDIQTVTYIAYTFFIKNYVIYGHLLAMYFRNCFISSFTTEMYQYIEAGF